MKKLVKIPSKIVICLVVFFVVSLVGMSPAKINTKNSSATKKQLKLCSDGLHCQPSTYRCHNKIVVTKSDCEVLVFKIKPKEKKN